MLRCIECLVQSLPFHTADAGKRSLFWAGPPLVGHYRDTTWGRGRKGRIISVTFSPEESHTDNRIMPVINEFTTEFNQLKALRIITGKLHPNPSRFWEIFIFFIFSCSSLMQLLEGPPPPPS